MTSAASFYSHWTQNIALSLSLPPPKISGSKRMESPQTSEDAGIEVSSQSAPDRPLCSKETWLHLDPNLFSNPDKQFSAYCTLQHLAATEDSCRWQISTL